MAQEQGIHTATSELYRLFHQMNCDLFNNELPLPQITIQKGSIGILGWVTVGKMWRNATGDDHRYEITIVAENLARTPMQIASTLLHEMCHLANLTKGIRDCSGHQYHNKHFKNEAERVGLEVQQVPQYGFAVTRVGEKLAQTLGARPVNPEAFAWFRSPELALPTTGTGSTPPKLGPRGGKSPTKMKKWMCDCGMIVRCARDLHAHCQDCNSDFTLCE